MNRKLLQKALLVGAVIEAILISISLWFIYEGGMHPGGGFFAVLHLPSSIVFGFISRALGGGEAFFMLITVISQFVIFAGIVYLLQQFSSGKRD